MDQSAQIDSLLSLLDRTNDLKQLPRTGWLLAGVAPVESVAEHSFGVALLALMLAELVNDDWAAAELSQPLDMDRVVRLALIHDLAESLLTDLPKRSAELVGLQVKHDAEARAMHELLADLAQGGAYWMLWQEYDSASTPEARLVKDADKLEMVHQAWRYEARGQANLDEFWQGHRWYFSASDTLFTALQARRR